jgi:diguanylate cyclase (GGDEF)-like protein
MKGLSANRTMGLPIDPSTMFLALVASTAAAVLLLFWCYAVNRGERSLLWIAVAFFLTSFANLLFGNRESLPEWVAVDVGVSLLLVGISCVWCAARVFNGKPITPWLPLAGPVLWLLLCRVPAFYENHDARMIAATALTAAWYLFAAREFFARDGLVSRYAVAAALVVHAMLVLARIPAVVVDGGSGFAGFSRTPWFGIATLEAVIFIQVMAFLMVSLTKERVENRLRAAAHTDSLTGLANRRAFFEWGEGAVARSARNDEPLSVILFDLDRFKEINDRFGHPVGDAVIQTLAAVAKNRLRAGDFVARLGGDEFAVALPGTNGAEAALVALQIGQAFEATVAAMAPSGLSGAACAGVAECPAIAASLEALLAAADRALYEAKALGRGQVRVSEPPPRHVKARAA